MKTPVMRHPDEEQLLRFADGELPARAAGEVRSHLEACWQCRAQYDEVQNTVSQCVGYRKNVLQRHLPAPPAPWTDIYQRFAEIDASLQQPSLLDRAARVLQWPIHNAKKWVPVAVAAMIVWGLFSRFHLTPSAQAAELLRKAIVAADTRPVKTHRLEIRTKEHRLTRFTGTQQKLAANAADAATLDSLQAQFQAANYDWNDPLSARAYQAWRDRLTDKRDEVVQDKDPYVLKTDSGSGELREATLKIRTQDLQPMEGRFEFRNGEWVEITALADEAAPSAIATTESHASLPSEVTLPTPTAPAAPTIGAGATISDELRVMAALHQVGADLGDPLEISRTGAEILVTGVGIAPQRQQQIMDAVGGLPHVAVRFNASVPAAVRPERNASENAAGADLRQLQARVAEQIGGRANFEQLASEVLDLSEPMMSRAYALRHLAERFPASAEGELSATDRQLLRQIQREHAAALRQQTGELDRLLKPVRASVRGSGGVAPDATASATAEDLFQSARRVDKLLAVIFGAAAGDSADDQLPSQLLSSLAQLRAKVEAYDRVSAKLEK
jgi:hypothetical protein